MRKYLPITVYRQCLLLVFAISVQCFAFGQQFASLTPGTEENGALAAQGPENKKELKKVLEEMGARYQINFIFDNQLIDQKMVATPENSDPMEVSLRKMLKPLGLAFKKLDENNYVIRKGEGEGLPIKKVKGRKYNDPEATIPSNLMPERIQTILVKTQRILQQTISGKVTDGESGDPLPGVNVLAKGTTIGTVTDIDGNYRLTVDDAVTTLIFSSIGYLSQEMTLNGRTVLDLMLMPDIQALKEVVVIGYGAVEKRDLTGSVSSVGSREIERVPVLGLDQALQGRAAGVFVSNNNANPGGEVNIRIRGTNSIQGNNEPLYVIDGYIGGNINTVNPTDIASIEVLKDASATAIYGARGANGVVIITTKRGTKGQNNLNFDMFYGWQSSRKKIDLMGARDYADFINRIDEDRGLPLTYPNLDTLPYDTDWQDEILRTAPWQQYSLSAGGGADKISYYVSGAYISQQGIVKETGYGRFNIRANIDAEVSDRVTFGTRLGFSRIDRTRTSGEEVGRQDDTGHPVARSLNFQPTATAYDEDGNLLAIIQDYNDVTRGVPLFDLKNNYQKQFGTNFTGNLYAEIQLFEPLKFRTSFGFNVENLKRNSYKPSTTWGTTTGFRNSAGINTGFNTGWLNENYLTYDQKFGVHALQVVGGMTLQGNDSESLGIGVSDFAVDDFLYNNISAGSTVGSYGSDMSKWRQASFFGRVQYTLKDKYLFTFNGRYDGSSKFGKENKWAFFPSGAIAWRLSDEDFIEQLGVFSDMKLRASYGISGSEALGPYRSLSAMESRSAAYIIEDTEVVGFYPSQLPNPDLQWEQTRQLDIGLDFGVLDNRLNFVLDYFDKTTNDLFLNKPVPQTSGVRTILDNIGSLRNSGFELGIDATPVAGDFTWKINLNGTYQQSEILDLGDEEDIITGSLSGGYSIDALQIMKVGKPLGAFYGYKTDGTWSTSDDLEAYTQFGSAVEAGDLKFLDANGDKDVNAEDRQILGYAQPKFFGGINNFFTYKGLDLSVFFQFVTGTNVFNGMATSYRNTGTYNNKHVDLNDAWTPENQDTDIPRAGSIMPREVMDIFVEDGSLLRMREVTLGYSLPTTVLNRVHISKLRFYATGANLLTFTKYTGYDPEVNIAGGSINVINFDNGSYPRAKSLILGLNLTF